MKKTWAFTLVELLVVIAVVVMLIAIIIPSLARARSRARSAVCLSNTRQLIVTYHNYVQAWNSVPYTDILYTSPIEVIMELGGEQYSDGRQGAGDKVRYCPEASVPRNRQSQAYWWGSSHCKWSVYRSTQSPGTPPELSGSYGMNQWLAREFAPPRGYLPLMEQALNAGRVNPRITRDASRVPAFYDCAAPASQETDPYSYIPQVTQATRMGPMLYLQTNVGPNLNLSPRPPTWDDPGFGSFSINRHDMAINVAFVDGHAETVKLPDLYTLKWSEAWTQTSPKAPRPLPDFLD